MFKEFWAKKEAKKEEKKADKTDKYLDSLEEAIDIRMTVSERKKEQKKRASDIEWVEKHLNDKKLMEEISEAKSDLWVVRDQLYNIIDKSVKEYVYLQKQPESYGKKTKMEQLNKKYKNAFYALTLVQQVLERLEEMPSEYEWKQIIKDLTNGYKVVNAISTGSDLLTRLSFWMQKTKMELKGEVSAAMMEDYFGKPIDEILQKANIDKACADILVSAQAEELSTMSKQAVLDAARNGVFVSVQPQEIVNVAKSTETLSKQANNAIGFEDDSTAGTKEMNMRERMKMIKSL